MDPYCDINNAYNKKPNDNYNINDLEKAARKINNDKKIKSKDVYRQYRNDINTLDKNASTYANILKSKSDNGTLLSSASVDGFYSAQGDYAVFNEQKNNIVDNIIKPNVKNNDDSNDISLDISLDTPSTNISSDNYSKTNDSLSMDTFNSSITLDTNDIDKEIKTKSKFNIKKKSKRHKCMDFDIDIVDSIESLDSGESLLRHIRYCKECKDKVMNLIKKNNNKKKCLEKVKPSIKKEESITNTFIKQPEIKEIITVCLIGFLVIIILDLIMKNR